MNSPTANAGTALGWLLLHLIERRPTKAMAPPSSLFFFMLGHSLTLWRVPCMDPWGDAARRELHLAGRKSQICVEFSKNLALFFCASQTTKLVLGTLHYKSFIGASCHVR